jgi:hypothetical protein
MILSPCKSVVPKDELASYEAAITENPNTAVRAVPGGRRKRAIGTWNKFWINGRTLKIAFMGNPPEALRQAIQKQIIKWQPSVNLTFEFVESGYSDIRIKTGSDENASAVGTDALLAPQDEPTLYLSIDHNYPSFEGIVLHEFGHALGLQHEHQHPKATIPWDKPKTYKYYKEKYDWDEDVVDFNLFKTFEINEHFLAPYDKDSIMHYVVDNEVTLGDFEVGENSKISMLDRRAMRKIYPKSGPTADA